jgi:hypothetical protein
MDIAYFRRRNKKSVKVLFSLLTFLCVFAVDVNAGIRSSTPPPPRPDFYRPDWQSLNGAWQFAFDPNEAGIKEAWYEAGAKPYSLFIQVPFPWESRLSGIGRLDYKGAAWYRREFTPPKAWQGRRVWLCFGAVDWQATVWINGARIGEHEGGYSEFRMDVTNAVRYDQPNQLVVRAVDVTDRETPIGKQVSNWYTSTSGIWQTVWLEATGPALVQSFQITPLADKSGTPTGAVRFDITVARGTSQSNLVIEVRSTDQKFATVQASLLAASSTASLTVRVPNPQFWTPDTPALYPAAVRLRPAVAGKDAALDEVHTYFGIRTVSWGKYGGSDYAYVLLNGKPVYLRGALDQSFNPEGIYTAPSDRFLERDIALAKAAGFNMLRIHIKADEPRKLYWADRLGMLIQADVPCAWAISERARRTFELTLRDQIRRDFNHPSIYAWTMFNEEWGIGKLDSAPKDHRVDWVERMWRLTKELDPTRLVQDNTGWSHLITDLNSFHWYGRDVDGFRTKYREINDRHIKTSDAWNYIAERRQRGEPFVNNEYGYVSAGNGDGDWSWGVLFATNALRACERLVGYTYTELTDIEWEHNGVYNYDRSPKEFGYDFWAPGMTVRDVFAEDFLVLDVPAIKYAKPGEAVRVPVSFSHYSGRYARATTLMWQVRWLDALGLWHEEASASRSGVPTPVYRLTPLGEIAFTLPAEPSFVTLVAWLVDEQGTRVHTNYTQWRVRPETPSPRVERLDDYTVLLRFRPEDWAVSQFSEQNKPAKPLGGKQYGRGHGFVEYRLRLPDALPVSSLRSVTLMSEVSAKAGREKVDWAARVKPEDYPQTDATKVPTTVKVQLNGVEAATWHLPDDPADARGVLSHWHGVERGSYGYRMQTALAAGTPTGDRAIKSILEEKRLVIRWDVPETAPVRGGLAIYGETMGCYTMDPTIVLRFTQPLPLPAGWRSTESVAVDRAETR